ncbi:MAG TPA: sulfite exporter TauE/SafE family protein [Dissulfurispiraceae bacterium]|nr:sulfite exporter TauE/SafE family protein [Dissulfurispiraceae bacterium]
MQGLLIGLFGGFFGALVGLGGGVVMIPLMISFLKFTQHEAHGTSLVAVVFVGAAGAATYALYGTTDWKIAILLALTATATARLGALFAHSLPEKKLKRSFGYFLIFVSVLMLVKGYLPRLEEAFGEFAKMAVFLGTGALTGFVSGMMGVGGGTVMVPPMVLLGGMSQQLAQGTSLLAMIPVGIAGAYTHYKLGNVKMNVAPGLAIGAVGGSYFGGAAANMLPDAALRYIFAVVLIWLGLRYVGVKFGAKKA